jgi:hypothetical protein
MAGFIEILEIMHKFVLQIDFKYNKHETNTIIISHCIAAIFG